ncbi:hypothetical protein BASA61_005829 [Batrachochytrium salamandrivorans]|nr:hypothetical protein BASA61_005829 [Batrachochytrium salamandrivorans]KAH9250788.1 hypothetical protein BASA81_011376 [Batrachochytrium salamandrivorans]
MRLISFAMVSLLAITVSAQPPHNPDTDAMDKYLDDAIQNMHQYQNDAAHNSQQPHDADIDMLDQILNDITQNAQQPQGAATHSAQQSPDAATQNVQQPPDAATQSAQPSDQNIVMAEMNRLMGVYKIQNDRCFQIDHQISTDKQRDTKARDMIKRITIKLQETSLSDHERLELQQTARNLRMMADELTTEYQEQRWYYINSIIMRSYAHAEVQILNDNQKLIAEHNSKNEVKVGPSPNSCYNTDMLKKQYDRILKDIDVVLAEQKKIRDAMLLPGGDAFKDQSKQLDNMIRILQSYNVVARRILWQHMYSRPLGAGISESLDSYMHNIKI